MPRSKPKAPADKALRHVVTFQARLAHGPVSPAFRARHPVVARTVQMRDDHTLEALHLQLALAFGHGDALTYEFRLSLPDGPSARYVAPLAFAAGMQQPGDGATAANRVTLGTLGLRPGQHVVYLLDDGEEWWLDVAVQSISDGNPRARLPRVTERIGPNPRAEPADDPTPSLAEGAADAACLIGEMHLRHGEANRAIDAFSRALDARPTADAYEGRARAYLALAEADRARAQELRGG